MGFGLEMEVVIAYAFGLVVLYIIGYGLYKVFAKPLRWVGILLFNGVIGGVLLLVMNLVGGPFDLSMAINPITVLTAGFLGVPGVVLMIMLQGIL